MNITNFKEQPYFDSLPRYALPALRSAFDKAETNGFSALAIYNGLCRDLGEVGIEKPKQQVFNAWLDGIHKKTVVRPSGARIIDEEEAKPLCAEVDMASGPDQGAEAVMRIDDGKPFFTPVFPADDIGDQYRKILETATRKAHELRDAAIDDIVDDIHDEARKVAQQIVAAVLRDLLAEMERAA